MEPESRSEPHATPRLIAEHAGAAPGQTTWLGITFDIDKNWHIYWDGDGDTGQAVTAEFTLPPGCEVGPIVWPSPKRLILADIILDYVYEDRVTLLVPLTLDSTARIGDVLKIGADLKWMECHEECIPRKYHVELDLPIVKEPARSADAKRFDESRASIPRSVEESAKVVQSSWIGESGGTLSLAVPGAQRLIFYPHRLSARLADALNQADARKDRLELEMDPNPPSVTSGSEQRKDRVLGILEVVRAGSEGKPRSEFYSIDVPRPGGEKRDPTGQTGK